MEQNGFSISNHSSLHEQTSKFFQENLADLPASGREIAAVLTFNAD